MQRWVVRVVTGGVGLLDQALESGTFLQFLMVAGIVTIHRLDRSGSCFDVWPPAVKLNDTKGWAENLALGFRENGLNAVAAPEWPEGEGNPDAFQRMVKP